MCTPAIFTALSMYSTYNNIKAQNKRLQAESTLLATNAAEQSKMDLKAIKMRTTQEDVRITLEQIRRYRQGMRERGTLMARLSDAGVSGGTTIRDAIASVIQEESDIGSIETKRDWMHTQALIEQEGAIGRAKGQLSQSQNIMDSQTGGFATGLQLIGSGISGMSQGRAFENQYKTYWDKNRDTRARQPERK